MIRPRCRFCLVLVDDYGDICGRCADEVDNEEMVRLIEMDLEQLREQG